MQNAIPTLLVLSVAFLTAQDDPWKKSEILQPPELAQILKTPGKQPTVISVAFPVLYRSKHILHAVPAGPGSKPEGIELLKTAVAGLPKDTDVVIYCGCCPMLKCPNIRPAFRVLRELGYSHVRVLDIPTNMHTDWYSKDYPSEDGPASSGK